MFPLFYPSFFLLFFGSVVSYGTGNIPTGHVGVLCSEHNFSHQQVRIPTSYQQAFVKIRICPASDSMKASKAQVSR